MRAPRGEVVTAALLAALFAFMIVYAFRFPAPARLLPWLAGVSGLVFSLVVLVGELRRRGNDTPREDRAARVRRELQLFGWFGAFTASMLLLGVIATGLVTVFAFLVVQQRERLATAAWFSLGCAAVLYLTFELLLGLPLFEGFLVEWCCG